MKKKIIMTILMIFICLLIYSCTSCMSSSAQSDKLCYQDTLEKQTIVFNDTINIVSDVKNNKYNQQKKKVIVRKEIKRIEIDSTWKTKNDSNYKKLEKTEITLKAQQKRIDSLILKKK